MRRAITCWDNYWGLKYFSFHDFLPKNLFNVYNFASFEDAFDYLVKDLELSGEDILMPGFYCEDTANNFQKNLKTHFCKIDQENFDIDYDDFLRKIKVLKPKVVMIYNFFGKRSILYDEKEWLKYINKDTVLISDMAHGFLFNQKSDFITDKHFYIDSNRKCTQFMISHLLAPAHYKFNTKYISSLNYYKVRTRLLFSLKNLWLILANKLRSHKFLTLSVKFFMKHNGLIGNNKIPTKAFFVDDFLFRHLDVNKINSHKGKIFAKYTEEFAKYNISQIRLFKIRKKDFETMNFFPIRIKTEFVKKLMAYFYEESIVIDKLWDLTAIRNLDKKIVQFGEEIIVLPCTSFVHPADVEFICKHLNIFFKNNIC